MSLKDLLPPGTYEEITSEAQSNAATTSSNSTSATTAAADPATKSAAATGPMVRCPTCHKLIVYSTSNPYRPFCSERCKLIDLGAWASDERSIPGEDISEDDEYEVNDPHVPRTHQDPNR